MKKDLVVVSHFSDGCGEDNNDRFNYLAALASEEWRVELVTSSFSHTAKRQRCRPSDEWSYRLTYVHEPGYSTNTSPRRLYSHFRFGRNLYAYLSRRSRPDAILCAVPSLDAGLAVARYARRTGTRLVVDIQDVWPEAFALLLPSARLAGFVTAPLCSMAREIYRNADALVAVSETYLRVGLAASTVTDGRVVFLGTNLPDFDRAAAASDVRKPAGEFWVTYVGTLGRNYDLDVVTDALALLAGRDRRPIVFKVLGDGPRQGACAEHARSRGVQCDFLGRLPYAEMVGHLIRSDVAVNPIARGAVASIINKHGDYAAAGLPVVSTQESPEYRRLIEEYGCGINCPPADAAAVADAIASLLSDPDRAARMGKSSRRLAEERFDRSRTYSAILRTLA